MVRGSPVVVRIADLHEDTEWSQPDQLVYATVSALLRIAGTHEDYRAVATGAIVKFAQQIVAALKMGGGMSQVTRFR